LKIPRGDVEISRRADGLIEAGMLDVTHTIISTSYKCNISTWNSHM